MGRRCTLSNNRTFNIYLTGKSFYFGSVDATSIDDAVAKATDLWRTAIPDPFERYDEELIDVIAEQEVQS